MNFFGGNFIGKDFKSMVVKETLRMLPEATIEDYFPTSVGSYWIYKTDKGKTYMHRVASKEMKEGRVHIYIDIKNNYTKDVEKGKGFDYIGRFEYSKDGDIIYMNSIMNYCGDKKVMVLNPPVEVLKFPLSNGQKWGNNDTGEIQVTEEVLTVLGKKTAVYRMDFWFISPSSKKLNVDTSWLAQGIGVVKNKTPYEKTNDYETLELTEYKIIK